MHGTNEWGAYVQFVLYCQRGSDPSSSSSSPVVRWHAIPRTSTVAAAALPPGWPVEIR